MITQSIYLPDYDWDIKVFYAVDGYYIETIVTELERLGCSDENIEELQDTLKEMPYNVGMTYSNLNGKCSIVIIGLTSSAEEFQNTFDHEKGHLAMHISAANDIDPFSEEFEYLVGDIGQSMFCVAKRFLCDHCRQK